MARKKLHRSKRQPLPSPMPAATEMILIVDDDPHDAELMEHAFRKIGKPNPVHVCVDGDSALNYVDGIGIYADRKKFPLPFVVILDWKLLLLSGLEVLTSIRARAEMGQLCVVVLSASENPRDKEAASKAGADLFLLKPTGHFMDVAKTIAEFWDHCETPA